MKRITTPILTGALALSVVAPFSVFAATNADTTADDSLQKQVIVAQRGPDAGMGKHEQLMNLINTYAPDLVDDFEAVFEQLHPKLDEATKQKLDEIRQQLKDGSITQEEAEAQLAELGIEHPRFLKIMNRPELDEATKQKLDEIRQQLKDGSITQEEAEAQLAELGIEHPRFLKIMNRPELDEATKQKLDEIRQQLKDGSITQEEAEAQLAELGIEHPPFLKIMNRPELDEATKQKLDEIRQQLKDGSITQEEAEAQLAELGVPFRVKVQHDEKWSQLQQAVEANDTDQIHELLEQMLSELQEKAEQKAE
ncbi:hypothetical protein LOK74_23195 [Brevibacillus humidisoli]|uniref:hypothetical protein n=1 Tax=Brevibacillus humidisoli TaxID=2895522 RepID=UPI001E54764A|nr:hypothetical protein [Brevibacillus humidisoli]UFJ40859.1 hypothetical protein LOK74_23195 [Brevibacillus humidisoli]